MKLCMLKFNISWFFFTNCIVSIHINPHWISNSGLWKVILEIFQNGLGNRWRESCFTKTMLLHTRLCLEWVLCVTVALKWLITLHILLIWLFAVPQHEKKHLESNIGESSIRPMMWSYLQLRTFEDQDESFYTTWIQERQHQWKKCVDRRGDYDLLKNKQHLVKFDHCTVVSLWTFQPTLVSLHPLRKCNQESPNANSGFCHPKTNTICCLAKQGKVPQA